MTYAPTTAAQVVDSYHAAWRAGDYEGVRACVTDDVRHHIRSARSGNADLTGHDALLAWVAHRRLCCPASSWHEASQGTGDRHVMVTTRLRDDHGEAWRMLSIFRIEDGRIAETWIHEPF